MATEQRPELIREGHIWGSVAERRAAEMAQAADDLLALSKNQVDQTDLAYALALATLANAYATLSLACRERFA